MLSIKSSSDAMLPYQDKDSSNALIEDVLRTSGGSFAGAQREQSGDRIQIAQSETAARDCGPSKLGDRNPQLNYSSDALRPRFGTYNPIAPPGLAGSDDPLVSSIEETNLIGQAGGSTTASYKGTLADNTIWDSPSEFKADTTYGAQGEIISQSVHYFGDGVELTFDGGRGTRRSLDHVMDVSTTFNASSDLYETQIRTVDGRRFKAIANSAGKVQSLIENKGGN